MFDAHAVFKDAATEQVPRDLGVVTGALTRGSAKEESAEKVLQWLKERKEEREEVYKKLVG